MEHNELLNGRQRRFLRSRGHYLAPMVMVGQQGITENVLAAVEDNLQAHELIKVKLGPNCPLEKKEAAEQLAVASRAALVQLIGKIVLLFRENRNLPPDQQIHLPR